MASQLLDEDTPNEVTSGTPFNVKVTYESTTGGDLALSVDDGFAITPPTYTLSSSSPGSVTFQVIITRGTATSKGCTLKYTFGNVLAPRINEVKPLPPEVK